MKWTLNLLFIALFSLVGCLSANVEEDFPADPCSNTSATYSGEVLPIIRENCFRCHDTNTRFGGVFLEGYANVAAYALNGSLTGVMRGTDGFPIMPNDGVKMLECDILIVEQWVAEGAENN